MCYLPLYMNVIFIFFRTDLICYISSLVSLVFKSRQYLHSGIFHHFQKSIQNIATYFAEVISFIFPKITVKHIDDHFPISQFESDVYFQLMKKYKVKKITGCVSFFFSILDTWIIPQIGKKNTTWATHVLSYQ